MRINWKEEICGAPIMRVREMFRRAGSEIFAAADVAKYLEVPADTAQALVDELLRRGWLEPAPDSKITNWHRERGGAFYRRSLVGNAFAIARSVPRIGRTKADQLVQAFLQRIESIKADDAYGWYVHEAKLFGSYIDKAAVDLGDIDIAIDLKRRQIIGRDPVEYSLHRADLAGKGARGYLEQLFFDELEVRQYLKARSPYISMHPITDPAATNSPTELLYKAPQSLETPRFWQEPTSLARIQTNPSSSILDDEDVMEDEHGRMAKALGLEGEEFERYVHSHRNPAFSGSFAFDLTFELFGERVRRRARVVYQSTPGGEYYDAKKKALYTGWGHSTYTIELRGWEYPGNGEKRKPAWVKSDIDFLTDKLSDKIFDLIDEECQKLDAQRRRKARLPLADA